MDEALFRWINNHHAPSLDSVMLVLSDRVLGVVLLSVLGVVLLALRRHFAVSALAFVLIVATSTGAADFLGARVIKPAMDRQRPCFALTDVRTLWPQTPSPSMPSLHAADAMAFATALLLTLRRRWWALPVMFVCLWVGYSRVYLGVHWPSDVLVGFAWGMSCAVLAWLAFRRLRWPRATR